MRYSELKPGDLYFEDDQTYFTVSSPRITKKYNSGTEILSWTCICDGKCFEDSIISRYDEHYKVNVVSTLNQF